MPQRRSVAYAQVFLRDPSLVDRLLSRSSIGPDDLVYEIGAGQGVITARLAVRCRQVIAVEHDPRLIGPLRRRLAALPNVALYQADFLAFPLPETPYKVFANPPFNRTSAIVTRLTAGSSTPEDAYLAMQREAADRFLGEPIGTLYAALLRPWFEPTVVRRFHRTDFAPAPRVDVVMLRLRKRGPPLLAPADEQAYRDFVVYCFTAWRPALADTLAALLGPRRGKEVLHGAGVAPAAGPAGVRCAQWLDVYARFRQLGDERAWVVVAGAEQQLREQQAGLRKVHRTLSPGRRG